MKELYWITICGNLNTALWVFFGFAATVFVFLSTAFILDLHDCDDDVMIKWIKRLAITSLICCIPAIFIPSKRDMYMIYGVGSVVDYLQDNDEAKQLPDKTVKMLNQLCDKYIKEEEKQ